MGSKLRKLRVKAGAAGETYQRDLRRQGYAKERAARLAAERASRAIAAPQGEPSDPHPGLHTLRFGGPRGGGVIFDEFVAEVAQRRLENEARRARVRTLLGDELAAALLCETIEAYARYLAHRSVRPNHEVCDEAWEEALRQLNRGVAPSDLTAARWKALRDAPPDPGLVDASKPQRPPASGMRLARKAMPLLTLAALCGVLSGGLVVPPKEDP